MKRKKSSPQAPSAPGSDAARPGAGDRLQKVLAAAGIGSRRLCEELIIEGRVEIDGKVAELGCRADPLRQDIRIDGVRVPQPERVYFALNKPVGVVCTNYDPAARTRLVDLIETPHRIFPIGRLDRASEGLILLTNDGEFANEIAHPRYEVEKTYRVIVAGEVSVETVQKLLKGVYLAEGVARALAVRIKKKRKQSTEAEIVLSEGRNREIRRVLARLGHKVLRLKRIAIGPLRLGDMPTGAYRPLLRREVTELHEAAVASRQRHKAARQEGATGKSRATGKSPGKGSKSGAGAAGRSRGSQSKYTPPGSRPAPASQDATALPPSTRTGKVLGFDDDGSTAPGGGPPRKQKPRGAKRRGGPATQAKLGEKRSSRKSSRPPRKGKRS